MSVSARCEMMQVNCRAVLIDGAQAAGLGAVGYIIKPLRPAYVENFIRKLLGA